MVARLPHDEKRDPRKELDRALAVASWRPPSRTSVRRPKDAIPGLPDWWQSDEEASRSMMPLLQQRGLV
ncbi:hypothetical protein QNO07_09290 [Streptomyces sp. 549]|uniref:hypothetical protein n=1 Tax=Streptomyces sp. 549 TaxID=3049076 RepID=UPI0024C32755|nr:hypothetical protein [Streptomyces sp. 549]MDK1473612.1 hypothetical protein [Streptomyces sp. 549]